MPSRSAWPSAWTATVILRRIFVPKTKSRSSIGTLMSIYRRIGARKPWRSGTWTLRRTARPVIDENHPSSMSWAAKRATLLAQPRSIGWLARVPAVGGARVPSGRKWIQRPDWAAALHQNHVGLVFVGVRPDHRGRRSGRTGSRRVCGISGSAHAGNRSSSRRLRLGQPR